MHTMIFDYLYDPDNTTRSAAFVALARRLHILGYPIAAKCITDTALLFMLEGVPFKSVNKIPPGAICIRSKPRRVRVSALLDAGVEITPENLSATLL